MGSIVYDNKGNMSVRLFPVACLQCLWEDSFVNTVNGRLSMLAALEAVYDKWGRLDDFLVPPSGSNREKFYKVTALLYSLLVLKVRTKLRQDGGLPAVITRSHHIDEGHRKQWASQLYCSHTFLHSHAAVENNLLLIDAGQPRFVEGFSKRALRVINRKMRLKEAPTFQSGTGADRQSTAVPSPSDQGGSRYMRPSAASAAPAAGADRRATEVPSPGGQGGGRYMRPSATTAPSAGGVGSVPEIPPSGSDSTFLDEDRRPADSLDGSSTGRSNVRRSDGAASKSSSGGSSSGSERSLLATDSMDSDVSSSDIESDEPTPSRPARRRHPARAPHSRPPSVAARGRLPAARVRRRRRPAHRSAHGVLDNVPHTIWQCERWRPQRRGSGPSATVAQATRSSRNANGPGSGTRPRLRRRRTRELPQPASAPATQRLVWVPLPSRCRSGRCNSPSRLTRAGSVAARATFAAASHASCRPHRCRCLARFLPHPHAGGGHDAL